MFTIFNLYIVTNDWGFKSFFDFEDLPRHIRNLLDRQDIDKEVFLSLRELRNACYQKLTVVLL